jgi:hypothetical protein
MSSACVGGLCAISICVATGVALWKLGNNEHGILLAEVYVQVGDWGLLPAPEFPCAACGPYVPGMSTIASLSAT